MSVLLAQTAATAPSALPPGTDPAALYAAASTEIETHLGSAHAALFAQPAIVGGQVAWTAPGAAAVRFSDLSAADRDALLRAAGSIVSDVRRLVESGRAPALARAWPAMRSVPGPAALFAVDGRPVLAPWGQPGPTDVLGPHDDGVAWLPPPRMSWAPYAAALACVALLALAAGLLLPAWAPWAQAPAAMCRIDNGQMDLMRRSADAASRGDALKKLLAAVNDDVGRQQLLCPIPQEEAAVAPPPPQPTPPPPPPPPPPPQHAELPADRWNQHDLSMLDGCWHSTTPLTTRNEGTGIVSQVKEWRLCFNRSGRGRQSLRWTDGHTCTGPLSAGFTSDNELRLTDVDRCQAPGMSLRRGVFVCRRESDVDATCVRTDTEGPAAGHHQTGHFRR